MNAPNHIARIAIALLALTGSGWPTVSAAQGDSASALGEEWKPIDPARLQEMRGGFQLPGGPELSFGIERVVYINGEVVANVSVHIPDLGQITSDQAQALARVRNGIVVQIGEGNRFDPTQLAGSVVIQNTLDNQSISTVTRIQTGVDTLGAFQDLNANAALSDALLRVPGGP